MRATGINDSSTNAVFAALASLGKTLRKKVDGNSVPEDAVKAALEKEMDLWLGKYTVEQRINPLLGMPGLFISLSLCLYSNCLSLRS